MRRLSRSCVTCATLFMPSFAEVCRCSVNLGKGAGNSGSVLVSLTVFGLIGGNFVRVLLLAGGRRCGDGAEAGCARGALL